ncbi:MAG: hypothetical protein QOF29_3830 [bacterium]
MSSFRAAAAAFIAAGALASTALAPAPAHAGTYTMNSCEVPGQVTGKTRGWTWAMGGSGLTPYDTCGSGGGSLGTYMPGTMAAGSTANINLFNANADIAIQSVRVWGNSDHRDRSGGAVATGSIWIDGGKAYDFGNGATVFMATPLTLSPVPASSLQIHSSCSGAGACTPDANPWKVYGVQLTLSDRIAPVASIDGGTLTAAGPRKATETVIVKGTDGQAGVRKLEVLLDDKVVGTADYARDWARTLAEQKAGTCRYDYWNACNATQVNEFSVNTKFLPDGVYALSVRATDAGGNVATAASAQAVTVDNVPDPVAPVPPASVPGPAGPAGPVGAAGDGGGAGASGGGGAPGTSGTPGAGGAAGAGGPSGSPGPAGPRAAPAAVLTINGINGAPGATLKAAFSTQRSTIRSEYGKKVLVTGRLVAPSGRPIGGARLAVLQQDKMLGAQLVPAGEVVTDDDGRFRYVTTATRSRSIRFGYRAFLEDTDFAASIDVGLGVIPALRLSTSRTSARNGQAVRFRGSIAGAPRNARKVIELQVRKGERWMTFRTTRLRNGTFSERYRFTNTHRRTTYVFRARVRQEAGFPFLTGHSKPIRVTVRG